MAHANAHTFKEGIREVLSGGTAWRQQCMQACAVIGCGPAGIAASTRLRQSGILVTCFELAPGPGGIWLSNSRDLFSSRGLVSPIYPSMRCVLPKDLMSYSDVRFDYTVPQFPHHSAVQYYLERSAEQKGVRGLTRFNTKVESVRFDPKDDLWKLITVNVGNGDVMEWSFDKVCVATGQTQEPRYPSGLREMLADYLRDGGELHHASHVKDFRAFRHKRVVVIGDGVSAYDYCMELKKYGAEVHHSTTLTRPRAGGGKGGGATLSSILFDEAEAASATAAKRDATERLRTAFFKSSAARRGWDGGQQPRADVFTTLATLLHKLPGRREDVHQANEVIRKWLRFRAANMEGIPRVGAPMETTEGRGIVFHVDPTRRVRTDDAVREARERRLAGETSCARTEPEVRGVHMDHVDAVISATGYTQRFPFLHRDLRRVLEDDGPLRLPGAPDARDGAEDGAAADEERGNRRGLYMGTLWAERPSLAFVGVQRELLPPFLMFEAQSRFVSYAFSQRMPLPQTPEEMMSQETQLVRAHPQLLDLYSNNGLGLHSAVYFNVLEQLLGISSRETYASQVMNRQWWLSASSGLRLYHKFRSMAPLKRKKQHILFSNKI